MSDGQFNALVAGMDPRDPSVRLRWSVRDPEVAALDLTFSAPKSVSVLAAAGSNDLTRVLVDAHNQAVTAALAYLDDSAVMVRRGHDGTTVQAGEGLIAAAYLHRMSRSLDPQLHTHVVAANLTRGPDGRFTALHGAPLYRAAKTAGYLYQSQLRATISERLGLEWGEVRKGAAELAVSRRRSSLSSRSAARRCCALRSSAASASTRRRAVRRRRSLRVSARSTGSTREPGEKRSKPARASSGSAARRSPTCSSEAANVSRTDWPSTTSQTS